MTRTAARATLAAALCALLAILSACGERRSRATSTSSAEEKGAAERGRVDPESHGEHEGPQSPPPVTVHHAGEALQLEPWTYCYDTGCADGAPPKNPPDVGSPHAVIVKYPLAGWSFKASFSRAGEECAREFPATLEDLGDGRFRLEPAGYADTYDVTLSGAGAEISS